MCLDCDHVWSQLGGLAVDIVKRVLFPVGFIPRKPVKSTLVSGAYKLSATMVLGTYFFPNESEVVPRLSSATWEQISIIFSNIKSNLFLSVLVKSNSTENNVKIYMRGLIVVSGFIK